MFAFPQVVVDDIVTHAYTADVRVVWLAGPGAAKLAKTLVFHKDCTVKVLKCCSELKGVGGSHNLLVLLDDCNTIWPLSLPFELAQTRDVRVVQTSAQYVWAPVVKPVRDIDALVDAEWRAVDDGLPA